MRRLDHSLLTPRLRLEPVTQAMARAAHIGAAVFASTVGAEAPSDWSSSSLKLVARSLTPTLGGTPLPTRAIAVHREDNSIVGDVRFEPSARVQGDVEIGYAVARGRRRQGYAVEATGALIDWLFDDAGVETLIAGCDSRNLASVRTLRRLGFWLDRTPGRAFWWLLTRELRSATRA
ncbi:MAG: GNAT family N-acetyltransferase [Hyphomonadaceae bacterium]|nr:GNAT family N-acetyltransferase [Hyphomonadaceae bacterium]